MIFHTRTDGGTIETCQDRFSEADLQHSKVTYDSVGVIYNMVNGASRHEDLGGSREGITNERCVNAVWNLNRIASLRCHKVSFA